MKKRLFMFFLVGLLFYSVTAFSMAESKSGVTPSKSLEIFGSVNNPLTLNIDDLKKMPSTELNDMVMAGAVKGFVGIRNYKGVSLKDILDKAGIKGKVKHLVFIVSATDGFYITLSWGEIYNHLSGDKVILAYERDGKPLGDYEGFIRLIVPYDTFIGDRAVKWVNKIEVKDPRN